MILDSNIVFSVELSLNSHSTIWVYESCHFAFDAPLYVDMVYYENNYEILNLPAHLRGGTNRYPPSASCNQKPTMLVGLNKVQTPWS